MLEVLQKTFGVGKIVTEAAGDSLEIDLIELDGVATRLYIKTPTLHSPEWLAAHRGMLAAFRIADLSCAAQDCKEARALAGEDLQAYYKAYQRRINWLTVNPPPDAWDGVYKEKWITA